MDRSEKAKVVAEALVEDFFVRFEYLNLNAGLGSDEEVEKRSKHFGEIYVKALQNIILEDFSDEEIDIFYRVKTLPKTLTNRLYDANVDAVAMATAEYGATAHEDFIQQISTGVSKKEEKPLRNFSDKPNGSLYLSKNSKFSDDMLERMIKECDTSIKN